MLYWPLGKSCGQHNRHCIHNWANTPYLGSVTLPININNFVNDMHMTLHAKYLDLFWLSIKLYWCTFALIADPS